MRQDIASLIYSQFEVQGSEGTGNAVDQLVQKMRATPVPYVDMIEGELTFPFTDNLTAYRSVDIERMKGLLGLLRVIGTTEARTLLHTAYYELAQDFDVLSPMWRDTLAYVGAGWNNDEELRNLHFSTGTTMFLHNITLGFLGELNDNTVLEHALERYYKIYKNSSARVGIEEYSLAVTGSAPPPAGSHYITLNAGWNMISAYLEPAYSDLDIVLAALLADSTFTLINDAHGKKYWPAEGIYTLQSWDYQRAYKIRMAQADTLVVSGRLVQPELEPIVLSRVYDWNTSTGINTPAYLRGSPMPVDQAVASIATSLIMVKDIVGNIYYPEYGINTLGDMEPGQGYIVYLSAPDTLLYPTNGETLSAVRQARPAPAVAHYLIEGVTDAQAHLLVRDGSRSDGDEVGVWTTDGRLVGSGVFQAGVASVAIWGNEDDAAVKTGPRGAREGEALTLTVWTAVTGEEQSLPVRRLRNGIGRRVERLQFVPNAIWIMEP